MIYLISYDLHRPVQEYEALISDIKKLGPCIKPLKSQWFAQTNLTAFQIYESLKKHLDSDDRIFINELTSNRYGFLDTAVWDWFAGKN